jgi:prepilin-type N-terminal cleavage/methylation domain-containing protein
VRARRPAAGFSLLEVLVTASLLAVLLGLAFTRWQGYTAFQRLRYATAQVAADLRSAQERAKSERIGYTVAFTAGASAYAVARAGGGFNENTRLPDGVTAVSTVTVTFSAFGQPAAAQAISIRNTAGTGTVTVNLSGGVTYQNP